MASLSSFISPPFFTHVEAEASIELGSSVSAGQCNAGRGKVPSREQDRAHGSPGMVTNSWVEGTLLREL